MDKPEIIKPDFSEFIELSIIANGNEAVLDRTKMNEFIKPIIPLGIIKTFSRMESKVEGVKRIFTTLGVHPFNIIDWEVRDAIIKDSKGAVFFEQRGVEVPKSWSQNATNIAVSKYFRGQLETPKRETSVKQMITRVAKTVSDWGRKENYFSSEEEADAFEAELTHMLVNQMVAFNSPVWFNVGVKESPQCSACFILNVEDSMESILDWYRTEGLIFKGGSGSGINLSKLRSSSERLSGGGYASGPVSFMRGADSVAGAIKSGGTTRRAAKMVVLNTDHPDIMEFIESKAHEEKKAWALAQAGFDVSFTGKDWYGLQFQNANNSVRATDKFMKAVADDKEWNTVTRTTKEVVQTYKARDIMNKIAEAAWECGDPGMQFHTATNKWHTCKNSGEIEASNPCSEYVFLNNTSCNLASFNLMKFRDENGEFDVEKFKHAIDVMIIAMEIIVQNAGYPTPEITKQSKAYRTLGLGYANLGSMLMAKGLPYDSDEGRNFAAAITSLLTGRGYRRSALIAKRMGPFAEYKKNEEPFLEVIRMHRDATYKINDKRIPSDLLEAARKAWDEAFENGAEYGYRNAQISVLAPTGTIALMMDCDTTGVEPELALVKYKMLFGGGVMKFVNTTVPEALTKLGYTSEQISDIVKYLQDKDMIEGAPHIKEEHLPVFDCSFKPLNGKRSIHYMGHVKMMAAVQPFVSGAISKTVNMPNDVTSDDITQVYIESWKMGVKNIAIYRDGCKVMQPLATSIKTGKVENKVEKIIEYRPVRERLPDERKAMTHKFSVAGHEGYITVGFYGDGRPGEVFITMAKEGSTVSGLMDTVATLVSVSLQYGVPLNTLVKKFINMRFDPSGVTENKEILFAKSIVDYIFKWLGLKFLTEDELADIGLKSVKTVELNGNGVEISMPMETETPKKENKTMTFPFQMQADAPLCMDCGSTMIVSGSCYKCTNCGATSGCS